MGATTSKKKHKSTISNKEKKRIRQQILNDHRPLRIRKNIAFCGTSNSGKSEVINSFIKTHGTLKKEKFTNFSYNMNKTFNVHEYVDQNVVSSKTLKYFDVFLQYPDINTKSIDEIPQHIFHATKSNKETEIRYKCLTDIQNELLFSGYFRNVNKNLLELKDLFRIIQNYYFNDIDIDVYGIGINGTALFSWELNIDYMSNSWHQLLQNKTFANFVALIYIADLSCYDQVDDENVNEMAKSLDLFENILKDLQVTSETVTILFLNKRDLFEQKIEKNISLNICSAVNNEYKGSMEYSECLEFIRMKYLQKNPSPEEYLIYTHVTVGTDTGSMKRVFDDVQHIIINWCLSRSGLI